MVVVVEGADIGGSGNTSAVGVSRHATTTSNKQRRRVDRRSTRQCYWRLQVLSGWPYDRFVSKDSEATGCRPAALASGLLAVFAIVFMTIGLAMINRTGCLDSCETVGFTLLYAGLPISALFGVGFGELVVAWPLDITFWVVLGFGVARYADRRGRSAIGVALFVVLLALTYGLVLSQFVEIAI